MRRSARSGWTPVIIALLIGLGIFVYGVIWGEWWMWLLGLALVFQNALTMRRLWPSRNPRSRWSP
jgi:hypothetical protein